MDIGAYIREHRLADKDVVAAIREEYPKYDKTLNSKVKKPDWYGIQMVKGAEQILIEVAGSTAHMRRADIRTLPIRVQCRLSKKDHKRLLLRFRKAGYLTVQSGLRSIIKNYITEGK